MIMKKYLLAVLALGATMMMACQPVDDNGGNGGNGGNPAPVVADYNLTASTITEGYLENYGDMYGCGGNDINLTITSIEVNEATGAMVAKVLYMEYICELSNKSGLGTYGPAQINWETGEGLTVNKYLAAAEIEGEIVGCGYLEMNANTEEITAYEGIVSGDLTVSKEGENYVVKGLLTTLSGKTLNVDYTGALEYEDYSNQGGIAPLSLKKSLPVGKLLKK